MIIGVAALAALAMVFGGFRAQGFVRNAGDPYHYSEIARWFVDHGFDRVTRRAAMLYPHILWGIYELGGTDTVAQILHVFLHMGTCTMVFFIARRLYNDRTALIAGLIVALHPMLLRYVADLHTETLLTFCCVGMVYRAIRFYDSPTITNGILLGAVGMIGAIAKGVLLPILAAYSAVFLVWSLKKGKGAPKLLPVLFIGITATLVVAPWTYRNYVVSGGRFVLLTPGTPDAFLRGYIFTRLEFATLQRPPYTDAENESNALFRRIAKEAGTTWERDEIVDDVNNGKVMRQWILQHPIDTVRKVVVGLFTFWYEMTSFVNSLVPFTLAIAGWILAFIGLKRSRVEGQPFWLLLVPILALNVFVALLVPLGRYSVPILPCLSMLAAFGVDTLLARRELARSRQPSPAV